MFVAGVGLMVIFSSRSAAAQSLGREDAGVIVLTDGAGPAGLEERPDQALSPNTTDGSTTQTAAGITPVTQSTLNAVTEPPPSEQRAIVRREGSAGSSKSVGEAPLASTGYDIWRVVGALAVVVALILVMKWAGAKFIIPGARVRPTQVVQVVARSPIAPRQQVVLLRVGKRVVVVGDSGTTLSTLCEISDPDEVAALLGQLKDEQAGPAGSFRNLFGKASANFTETNAAVEGSSDDVANADASPDPAKPADLTGARAELGDLMNKVRQLSAQFRRS